MTNVRLMCKKGSKACKEIVENTSILRYSGKKNNADVLINYGLAGRKMEKWLASWSSAKNIPKINSGVGHSKLSVIRKAENRNILVPESKSSLSRKDRLEDWIEKRLNSSGGKGICRARGRGPIDGKYYQKMIKDRVYELRIHAFLWMDEEDWLVLKRFGDQDEIAWNFSQGGRFQRVRNPNHAYFIKAKEVTREVLEMLRMGFGAADFLVDEERNIYFIEVNSQPGFSGLSDHAYFKAFEALTQMPKREVLQWAR